MRLVWGLNVWLTDPAIGGPGSWCELQRADQIGRGAVASECAELPEMWCNASKECRRTEEQCGGGCELVELLGG